MVQTNAKKDLSPTQVRLVVEVDGNPVGFLSLDLDRSLFLHAENQILSTRAELTTCRAVPFRICDSRLNGALDH